MAHSALLTNFEIRCKIRHIYLNFANGKISLKLFLYKISHLPVLQTVKPIGRI